MTQARLVLVPLPGEPTHFDITGWREKRPAPLELNGGTRRLSILQTIEVQPDGHCATAFYQYRFLLDESLDSWLLRYEYYRRPPDPGYEYPLAHLHFNDAFVTKKKALERLHFPTARVPLESVLWLLLAEGEVKPLSDDWRAVLARHVARTCTRDPATPPGALG